MHQPPHLLLGLSDDAQLRVGHGVLTLQDLQFRQADLALCFRLCSGVSGGVGWGGMGWKGVTWRGVGSNKSSGISFSNDDVDPTAPHFFLPLGAHKPTPQQRLARS